MISRGTLFSFVLLLVLVGGLLAWSSTRVDPCTAFLQGNRGAPSTQVVEMGSRLVLVPCKSWLVRQPLEVQMVCLLGLVLLVLFAIRAVDDVLRWRRRVQVRA